MSIADRIELLLAVLLLAPILLWKPWLRSWAQRLAVSPRVAIALLAALPVVLRLLLLAHHPAPHPIVYDEFSHLLEADTLRHLRLANPPHALPEFFETFFVLQEPTYASIYPPGQGLVLAFGWTLFGHPWAGVLLAAAAFSAGCYWMLRGWTTPGWALVGGLFGSGGIWPAQPMDERLLGRHVHRGGGRGRFRRLAALAGPATAARHGDSRPRSGAQSHHPAI